MAKLPVYHPELDRYALVEEEAVEISLAGGWLPVLHPHDPRHKAKADADAEAAASEPEPVDPSNPPRLGDPKPTKASKTAASSGQES